MAVPVDSTGLRAMVAMVATVGMAARATTG
jgi:hypothetical protein